jgi:Putative zinc-finger
VSDISTDPFTTFDAAYVMGALSDDDRRAFEAHLIGCDACSAAVGSLRRLPGLLATVPASELDPSLVDEPPPDTLLPRLLREVRRGQVRRRWLASGIAAAVAACIIAVTAVVAQSGDGAAAGHPVPMAAVVSSPIHATADISEVFWGTQITLHCTYDTGGYPTGGVYGLVIKDRDGQTHQLGMWTVVPGKTTTFISGTALKRQQIAEVRIVEPDGTTLLHVSA